MKRALATASPGYSKLIHIKKKNPPHIETSISGVMRGWPKLLHTLIVSGKVFLMKSRSHTMTHHRIAATPSNFICPKISAFIINKQNYVETMINIGTTMEQTLIWVGVKSTVWPASSCRKKGLVEVILINLKTSLSINRSQTWAVHLQTETES